jgi:dihydrolipoamide dehydrogenase
MLESTHVEIGAAVHPHPTLSEVLKEVALAVHGEAIHI